MKKYTLYSIITLLIFSFFSCKDDTKKETPKVEKIEPDYEMIKLSSKRPNLNISVLLDLSDRINPKKYPSPAMDFYKRDIGYLKSIGESFEIHLMNKKSIQINDKIQAFIEPEPSDINLNKKIEALKISFSKSDATKDKILSTSKKYDSISKLIYEAAIKDNNYVGSDIWRFFKSKVNDYCIEENYRNILIVLTDGYIYHKDTKLKDNNRSSFLIPQTIKASGLNKTNWKEKIEQKDYGFITENKNLSNLEVLVLGINADKKNPYEEDVITAYWTKWFKEMNVKEFEMKQADLPSHMDQIIRSFILKE
ncbi:hypothetical protein Q4599_11595 [Cellulophaga lytica]|uniref:hypothetical protein n=1 Tax=Cellulophaga lytica TaxID=979 RepID=UPI0026E4779B|nr:hypothetical protein [Cellulophaga lytica]MDO6854224.1 hypothetical protein [Cellulophaga lytica]